MHKLNRLLGNKRSQEQIDVPLNSNYIFFSALVTLILIFVILQVIFHYWSPPNTNLLATNSIINNIEFGAENFKELLESQPSNLETAKTIIIPVKVRVDGNYEGLFNVKLSEIEITSTNFDPNAKITKSLNPQNNRQAIMLDAIKQIPDSVMNESYYHGIKSVSDTYATKADMLRTKRPSSWNTLLEKVTFGWASGPTQAAKKVADEKLIELQYAINLTNSLSDSDPTLINMTKYTFLVATATLGAKQQYNYFQKRETTTPSSGFYMSHAPRIALAITAGYGDILDLKLNATLIDSSAQSNTTNSLAASRAFSGNTLSGAQANLFDKHLLNLLKTINDKSKRSGQGLVYDAQSNFLAVYNSKMSDINAKIQVENATKIRCSPINTKMIIVQDPQNVPYIKFNKDNNVLHMQAQYIVLKEIDANKLILRILNERQLQEYLQFSESNFAQDTQFLESITQVSNDESYIQTVTELCLYAKS